METSTIAKMIRELTNKTVERGCTEAEAMAAANKIGQLLKQYNLSMSEIYLSESDCTTKQTESNGRNKGPIDRCLCAIANFCDCKVWFDRYRDGLRYNFFGLERDTELAIYLYSTIRVAMGSETFRFKQTREYHDTSYPARTLSTSFQKGMADRISKRLREMTANRKREESVEQVKSTGTDLVPVKQSKIDEEFKKLNLNLGKGGLISNKSISFEAYMLGKEAGDRVSLSKPIDNKIAGQLR